DARKVRREIERGAFGRKDRARMAGDFCRDAARLERVAVAFPRAKLQRGIDTAEGLRRAGKAREHARLARRKDRPRLPSFRDRCGRRDVARAAQVLVERAAHGVLNDEGIEERAGHEKAAVHGQAAFAVAPRAISRAASRVMKERAACAGLIFGKSLRKWPPRLSLRANAEAAIRSAAVAMLRRRA